MSTERWTPFRLFWLVFLPGPVIWSAHFMVVYLVTEAACAEEVAGPGLAPDVATEVTIVATVLGVIASVGFALLAHRRWRAGRREAAEGHAERPELAFAGLLMSWLSVLAVLAVGLPALWLSPC